MREVLEFLENLTDKVSGAIYTYILVILLVLGGFYFTFRTKFVQFRLFKEQFRVLMEKPDKKGGVSSFQALMVSTASRVGTGNIIGVATAICLGGFGSVFWMWLIALIGCATAFIESTLAQIYKKKGENGSYGGPAHYIETALKSRGLALVFTILMVLTYGLGFNMLASYNLQDTFSGYSFYNAEWTPWIIGFIVALLVSICLFGGGKRLVKTTEFLVPIMGVIYVLVAIIVIALNITSLPAVFKRIFVEAFDFKSIFGGFTGSCVMLGIKRGLFSNEAGVGSAPNASASAEVAHPVKQGLVQMLSVFIDTILICSATAFLCMCSGVEPTSDLGGAAYVQRSLHAVLGDFGPIFVTVAMCLFAFTTLLGNLFYVDKGINHLLGREADKKFKTVYYIVAALIIFIGAGLNAGLLWNIADILMALMTIINIPVIIYLGKYSFRALKDYQDQRKKGKEPVFHAESIDLPHKVDYWD